jgi:hypothetical protein
LGWRQYVLLILQELGFEVKPLVGLRVGNEYRVKS